MSDFQFDLGWALGSLDVVQSSVDACIVNVEDILFADECDAEVTSYVRQSASELKAARDMIQRARCRLKRHW